MPILSSLVTLKVVILKPENFHNANFTSLVTLKVVILTTFNVTSNDKVGIMITFSFQCFIPRLCTPFTLYFVMSWFDNLVLPILPRDHSGYGLSQWKVLLSNAPLIGWANTQNDPILQGYFSWCWVIIWWPQSNHRHLAVIKSLERLWITKIVCQELVWFRNFTILPKSP